MGRIVGILYILSILLAVPLTAEVSEFYADLSRFSDFFIDPNTGTTAFPTLRIPVGGLYEGMGTAYSAVASDSGFLESNPAGSAVLKNTELSLHHHNWIADSKMEGVVYTMRFNDLGIGFGGKFLYVPFTEYNLWNERVTHDSDGESEVNKFYYTETVATMNISYNFFSSYYFYGLSIGSNLKVAYRHIPSFIQEQENLDESQSGLMAMFDVGLLTRFNFLKFYTSRDKNFSIGTVVKNLGPAVNGDPLPGEFTTGFSWAPVRPLLVSYDFSLPFILPTADGTTFDPPKWHMAAGVKVQFAPFFGIHGGFRFPGGNPRISLGSTIDLKRISFVINYILDLSTNVRNPADSFSIEAKLNLGDRGRAALQTRIDELYVAGLEAFAKGNLERAVEYWEQVLELDPDFQPARANLEIARTSLELRRQMEKIQTVR
jgi:tetratricopeptide (TPR) repeat protein